MNVPEMVAKYNLKPRGVIQAGSHHGEEIPMWNRMGINQIHFEPSRPNYTKLMQNYPEVPVFPVALGRFAGTSIMFTETVNGGQSNSLLRPGKHLEILPWIKFNGQEWVVVLPLNYFIHAVPDCNFMYIDAQGSELDILLGASVMLERIDFIFTEVNRAEVFEGCSKIEDIDFFLSSQGFKRVETEWHGGDFGDALYIRKSD